MVEIVLTVTQRENRLETVQWKKPRKRNVNRLIYKQFVQVSGLCGPQFLSYLPKRFTHLILEMVIQLKIKRRDFFQRDRIPILVSRTVKTRKFKLLYFQNETCYRNGNLYNDLLFVCLQPSVNEKFVKPCYFDLTI